MYVQPALCYYSTRNVDLLLMPDSKICEPGWAVPIFHSPSGERKEHHQSETRAASPTCADNIQTLYLLIKKLKKKKKKVGS